VLSIGGGDFALHRLSMIATLWAAMPVISLDLTLKAGIVFRGLRRPAALIRFHDPILAV
jgi:hypothetical protein